MSSKLNKKYRIICMEFIVIIYLIVVMISIYLYSLFLLLLFKNRKDLFTHDLSTKNLPTISKLKGKYLTDFTLYPLTSSKRLFSRRKLKFIKFLCVESCLNPFSPGTTKKIDFIAKCWGEARIFLKIISGFSQCSRTWHKIKWL